MIRFRFSSSRPEDFVSFSYSSAIETVQSLHVLTEPRIHTVQHPLVRGFQSAPASVRRQFADLGFVFAGRFLPDFLMGRSPGGPEDVSEVLEALGAVPEATIAREVAKAAKSWTRRAEGGSDRASEHYGISLRRAGDAPSTLRADLRSFLGDYWEQFFRQHWPNASPLLSEATATARETVAQVGLFRWAEALGPRVRVSRADSTISIASRHQHEVFVSQDRPLEFFPSYFVWPHTLATCDEPWPLRVIYPAPAAVEESRATQPPPGLIGDLRAVADDTRLRILASLVTRPRSTQELAALVHVTEPAVSRHLSALRARGFVTPRRSGAYVLYDLRPEAMNRMVRGLGDYMKVRPRDPGGEAPGEGKPGEGKPGGTRAADV